MSLRDELLPVIEEAYGLLEEFGLRKVRVWIRAEASTQPYGTGGVVVGSDVEITPRPRVAKAQGQPGFFGAELSAAYDGRAERRRFTVGPIVRKHAAGGVTVEDLFPAAATPSARPLIILADDATDGELGTEGRAFKVERVTVRQFSLVLEVVEADELT